VMKLGGKGFILFARANPDTPGKLLAHALSYEALEEASYALLELVALKADEGDVAMRAAHIRGEELAMQDRLAACFDETVELVLTLGADDPRDHLRKYLADAHAIEMQSIGLLERASAPESGVIAEVYQHHLAETQDQAEALESQLKSLGGAPSSVKDTALRIGAANWSSLFEAQPATPGKLAAFAYAFEHLEIGGYEQLKRVAERVGDPTTAQLVAGILEQERTAAAVLRDLFPVAAELSLAAAGAPS
jgi:ferritin-like metal-binding protein YciE